MKKFVFTALTVFAIFCSGATSIISESSGIQINETIAGFKFEFEKIDGKDIKKCVFPDDYLKAGHYPETEFFEKTFHFAVPEGSSPSLDYSLNGTQTFNRSELVTFESFKKGKNGMIISSYEIPEHREDRELKPAELNYFGRMNNMDIYRVIFRPLTVKKDLAVISTGINIKVKFGRSFENPKAENKKAKDSFENSLINLDYALNNPVKFKKQTSECFLDRQTEWMKLKIKDEGIYKVTGSALRSEGADLSAVLCSRIKVYSGAGKDIENNPVDSLYPVFHGASEISRKVVDLNSNGYFEDGDQIIFYAAQTTQRGPAVSTHYCNMYSENTYYWIDLGIGSPADGRVMVELSSSPSVFTEKSVFQRHVFAEKRNSLLSADDTFRWYNFKVEPLQTQSVEFAMKDIDRAYPVKLKVNHAADISQNLSRIKYSINNNSLSDTTSYTISFDYDLKNEYFSAGSVNRFSMTNIETGYTKYYNGFDILYYGKVTGGLADEYFSAQLDSSLSYKLNFDNSSGQELFDITDPQNVRSSVLGGDFCYITADKDFNSYLLFSGSYKAPADISIFDNSAVQSLHSRSVQADMVIISPPEFYDFLKNDEMNYIQAHLGAGNDVSSIEVINIDDISNEFGRGYQEPAATRNFIKYAYENWGTEYILLAGDGNCYIKNETGVPEKNFIYTSDPAYSANTGRGSDDFYANLYSKLPAQDIALGRFTVSSLTELRNVVSKTVSYINNNSPGIKKSKILLVADDERNPDYDRWYETEHIENTESRIFTKIPGYYYSEKLYSTEFPFEFSSATGLYLKPLAQAELSRKLQSGVNVFCYVGHGAPMQLAHERLFTASSFANVYNYEKYFFMIGATCSFGVFNDPEVKYLAEQMLISPNKGSIGLINSVAPVYSGSNEGFVGEIFEAEFFDPVNKLTIGKALKTGKNNYPVSNSSCYMLIGDPALMFFNDKAIVESEPSIELNTLVLDSIISSLNTSLSPGVTDTNGYLNTTIIDSEVRRAYFNTERWEEGTDSIIYSLPGKAILSANSTISSGSSTAEFILPKDLTYGDNKGKVLFYGYNLSGDEFSGSINSVSIRGDAAIAISDTIPPEIKICFNSLNYIAGDPIGQSPVIFAEISDANGINTSGGIGHKIIMEIDGEITDVTPYFVYDTDSYKKGHTSYQPATLEPGEHNIKISAWDAFNNYSEKAESFEVVQESDNSSARIGNLLNYPNPIRKKGTTFGFAVDSQADLESYTITIYTINGRKVKIIGDTMVNPAANYQQCFWDGKDDDGDIPANGVYIYILRARFSGDTVIKKGKLVFGR